MQTTWLGTRLSGPSREYLAYSNRIFLESLIKNLFTELQMGLQGPRRDGEASSQKDKAISTPWLKGAGLGGCKLQGGSWAEPSPAHHPVEKEPRNTPISLLLCPLLVCAKFPLADPNHKAESKREHWCEALKISFLRYKPFGEGLGGAESGWTHRQQPHWG